MQKSIECPSNGVVMEGGEPYILRVLETSARRFGSIYGEDHKCLIVGICSCGCAKWCIPRSFWVHKLTGQPSHVSSGGGFFILRTN